MIKKVNNNNSMVEIPEMTLKALKGLLFSDKDGVDINPIVEDLSASYDNKDLCAINVALTFKGIKPEICQKAVIKRIGAMNIFAMISCLIPSFWDWLRLWHINSVWKKMGMPLNLALTTQC